MNGWDELKEYLMNREFTPEQWETAMTIIRKVATMVLDEPESDGDPV